MGDDDKNSGRPKSETEEAKKKEAWMNKNAPVLFVAGGVLLIVLLGVAMKTCN